MVAEVHGALQLEINQYAVEVSQLDLVNRGRVARLDLTLGGYDATLTAGASLDWGQEPMQIRDGTLRAKISSLGKLPLDVPGAGSLELYETSFEGPVDAFAAEGMLKGRGLRFDQTRAQGLTSSFDFKNLPGSLAGRFVLNAQGVRQGVDAIGPVHGELSSDEAGRIFELDLQAGRTGLLWAKLKARAEVSERKTEVQLRQLDLRHKTLRAQLLSKPLHARITLWDQGEFSVEKLRLALSGGTIAIDGSLDEEVKARVNTLRVTPLLSLFPSLELPVQGAFSGTVTASRSDQGLAARAKLVSPALRLTPESPALHTELSGSIKGSTWSAGVSLQSESQGSLALQASIRPPAGAWTKAAGRLLRSARLEFEHTDLKLLRPLHKDLASLGGELHGEVKVGAGVGRIDGKLVATDLVHRAWSSKRGGEIEIHATRKAADLGIKISDSKIGGAEAQLRLFPPGPLHSPWRWPQSALAESLGDSTLTFGGLDLIALLDEFQGEATLPIEKGIVSGSLRLRDRGKTLELELDAKELQLTDRPALSAHIESTFMPDRSEASWDLEIDSQNRIRGGAKFGAGLSLLRYLGNPDGMLERIRRASLRGSATLESDSPALLARMAGATSDVVVTGQITAGATINGSIDEPHGSLQVNVSEAKVDGVPLQRVSFTGEHRSQGSDVDLRIYQSRDRYLSVEASFDLEAEELRSAAIEARGIDLRLFRALDKSGEGILASVAGVANGKLDLRGDWRQPVPSGKLQIRDGEVSLGGSLMPIVGLSLDFEAKDQRLTLEGKGKSGSGRLEVSAQAKVKGRGIEDLAVRLRSTKLPVVVASLVCSVDLETNSQVSWKPGLVDIRTKIDRALVRIPIRGFSAETRSLHAIDGMSDLIYLSDEEKTEPIELDEEGTKVRIHVRAKESVRVQTRELLAVVDVDLTTTVDSGIPFIKGNAHVVKGRLDLFDRRYNFEKASAEFHGRAPVNPSFRLQLRHEFDQLALTILGEGTLEDPKISFLADPPDYDQATLLAIVLGQAPSQTEDNQGLRDNALGALSSYAAGRLKEVLGDVLPFSPDEMRVEKTENDGQLYITGKWINDNWYVVYHHRTIAEELENTNEVESRYKLNKNWTVEGVVGDEEAGLDIIWSKRWGK
jgi:hypothetical protein